LAADGNRNGVVDLADMVLWRKNLGQSIGAAPALAVQAGGSQGAAGTAPVLGQSFATGGPADSSTWRALGLDSPSSLASIDDVFADMADDDLLLAALQPAADSEPLDDLAASWIDAQDSDEVVDRLIGQFSGVRGVIDSI
ncbi:MAG TPA: hypothetical protein VJ828_19785, partial [Lacipirellulaceae bacterium]|nr:hypothetical protein [Lacipirellulaceae bacterium]